MQEAVVNKIKSKIAHCKFGEVFFVSSFPQYDVEYVTKLASEIAKRDKAVIIPTGVTAANQLGFSTQMPMTTSFLTTGSSRKLSIGKSIIVLKHGAPRKTLKLDILTPKECHCLKNKRTSSTSVAYHEQAEKS